MELVDERQYESPELSCSENTVFKSFMKQIYQKMRIKINLQYCVGW